MFYCNFDLTFFPPRFWITIRRCEKTIQHLPALASEHLPLLIPPDHELAKFSKHRLFIKLCKHQEYYIVSVLFAFLLNFFDFQDN